jgi:SAM-dependent methyltransferase
MTLTRPRHRGATLSHRMGEGLGVRVQTGFGGTVQLRPSPTGAEDFIGQMTGLAKNLRRVPGGSDSALQSRKPWLGMRRANRFAPPLRRPTRAPMVSDPSGQVETRYRNAEVAANYDRRRYADLQGRLNNRTAWRALRLALRQVEPAGRVLDIPCGTGRFSRQLAEAGFPVVASDISMEMLGMMPPAARVRRFQGDIFHLPFQDQAFAAVICIRFFNLVDRVKRVEAVREMARVADVVIAGYYHKYTLKYASRWMKHRLGLHKGNNPRLSRAALADEIRQTGLQLVQVIPVAPLLSEEWLVVLRRPPR